MTRLKRERMYPYSVRLFCENCEGKSEMRHDGSVLTSYPAQYPHECPSCGFKSNEKTPYPTMEYLPHERTLWRRIKEIFDPTILRIDK